MRSSIFGKIKTFLVFVLSVALFGSAVFNSNFVFASVPQDCNGEGDNCRIIKTYANNTLLNTKALNSSSTSYSYSSTGWNGAQGNCSTTVSSGGQSVQTFSYSTGVCVDKVEVYDKTGTTLLGSTNITSGSLSGSFSVNAPSGSQGTAGTTAGASGTTSSSSDSDETCGSLAGSTGWIVCPGIELAAEGSDGIYGALAGFLNIDPVLVSGDYNTSPAYRMWQYFRNVANILLVVIMLAIIFSQITGFGIDNYGIKRMLPRLIVAGILLNLSYFIVQLAVDVSNILGNSLSSWLDAIASSFANNNVAELTFSAIFDAIIILVGAGVGVASVAGGALTIIGAEGITLSFWILIIPLIIAIIVALVSVLIFFLMLAARQLVVMVCAAIAPLAFVCYILPNTQSLFKKWVDLLKAMLIIYPVCSVLYGISSIIKTLAFSAEGVHLWSGMIALMSSFLPFLVAPSMVRKAFNSLGEVGARIQGLGNSVRRGAENGRRAFMASDRYRNAAKVANDYRAANSANKVIGKYGNRNDLSTYQKRRLMSAYGTLESQKQERQKMESEGQRQKLLNLAKDDPENISQEALETRIEQALNDGNTEEAIGITDFMMQQLGGSKGSESLRRVLENVEGSNSDFAADRGNKRRDFLQGVAQNNLSAVMKKDFALGRTLATSGYNAVTGVRESTASLNAPAVIDATGKQVAGLEANAMKDEEAATLGKKAIQNMYMSGQISQSMAKRIIANDSLTRGMDDESLSMWNHLANGSGLYDASGKPLATSWKTEQKVDPATGPVVDADGNPVMRTYMADAAGNEVTIDKTGTVIRNMEEQAANQAYNDAALEEMTARRDAEENALFRQQEQDMLIRHNNTHTETIKDPSDPSKNAFSGTVYNIPRFQGGFDGTSGTWSVRNGDAIYTEGDLEWNASTARISRTKPQGDVFGPPVPPPTA